jgi:hypothetical protein
LATGHQSGAASRSRATWSGVLRDIREFILVPPATPTVLAAATRAEREDMSERIQQRLGIDVSIYSILNIHHIGVAVPGRDMFALLRNWDGDSSYWPHSLARPARIAADLETIEIRLFGWRRFLGLPLKPLFRLTPERIQEDPGPGDPDNQRYIMFSCSGGYPIGHFIMYVRSSIAARGETGPTQLFMAVGFNVYGRRRLARFGPARIVTAVWEALHNRVTSHVLNRLKTLCENELRLIEAGDEALRENDNA